MLDRRARALVAPPLEAVAARLAAAGVSPTALTGAGWAVGVGACVAAGVGAWTLALLLWLGNRLLDGLDGPVARSSSGGGTPTERGGFLDIVADFSVYAGFVLGVAVAVPDARLACVALLVAYTCSGTAFLALSSLLEKQGRSGDETPRLADGRSLRFVGGLAEGTETVIAYVLICLFPGHAALVAWVFAAMVAVTAGQRVITGAVLLRPTSTHTGDAGPERDPRP